MTIAKPVPSQNAPPKHSIPINRVLIVGGTHGNEMTGIYLIKTFEAHAHLIFRPSFETLTVIGNPQAMQQVTRYINKDLNRCFNVQDRNGLASPIYEVTRANALRQQYGQDSEHPIDLVIDLHSTTSNAGLMLILDHLDPFTFKLAAYLQSKEPTVKLYGAVGSGREYDSLRTLGSYRLGIEVGPIAHGTLHAELFHKTERLIYHVLDYVEHYNHYNSFNGSSQPTSILFAPPKTLTIYQYNGAMNYPKNGKGDMIAMIHPQRQFQDYEVLKPGDPMFLTFEGETIAYQGQNPVYPIFINEAAYYEKGIAMSLTEKKSVTLDKLLR